MDDTFKFIELFYILDTNNLKLEEKTKERIMQGGLILKIVSEIKKLLINGEVSE